MAGALDGVELYLRTNDLLQGEMFEALRAVIAETSGPDCSVVIMTDGTQPSDSVYQGMKQLNAPWGFGAFEARPSGGFENSTGGPPVEDLFTVLEEARTNDLLQGEMFEALRAVIAETSGPDCSVVIMTDGTQPSDSVYQGMKQLNAPWGFGAFEARPSGGFENSTGGPPEEDLFTVVEEARKLRKTSWCLTAVLMSNSLRFLRDFGDVSLKQRFLIWPTRLLVVATIPILSLKDLFSSYWTYSMMNAMVLTPDTVKKKTRYSIYSHLPHTDSGVHFIRIASWASGEGLVSIKSHDFFPAKFSNFHGSQVNVTALPFAPHWQVTKKTTPSGATVEVFSGTDYLMLAAIAKALNFTIYVLPTENWNEVTQKVEDRESFIATVIYALLPNRFLQYDYTFAFEFASPTFCMRKPVLEPQWQSLYRPLTDAVWIVSFMVHFEKSRKTEKEKKRMKRTRFGDVLQDVVGILLGQNIALDQSTSTSSRILAASWLVFALIIGVAYRGNLTAFLTLPKYPARAETLEELIKVADKVTMEPYGEAFRSFYSKSDSVVFQKLASIWETVTSGREGLADASRRKQAHIEVRRFLELVIAEQFTKLDGSTQLYLGRENVFPGLSGWPIPHDAPFKENLDRSIMAVKEAGLYEKWSSDFMAQARKESQERQMQKAAQMTPEEGADTADQENSGDSKVTALTIVHMQGPLMLLLLGLIIALVIFAGEMAILCGRCVEMK
ncbi:ionotropic receptor 21a-like [Palaemon carinicauda]|uniref:ionotropic receptor 21a-like n=1 Tax=Palaemon carinicauda TaxID=392227 RepID=UPI0035B616C4